MLNNSIYNELFDIIVIFNNIKILNVVNNIKVIKLFLKKIFFKSLV